MMLITNTEPKAPPTRPYVSGVNYQNEIQAMMFTFGEVRYPLSETSLIVEELLREFAIEMLTKASEISLVRGSKTISPEDLIFVVRDEPAQVIRLKEFLSWKDIRKNVKPDSNDTAFEEENSNVPEDKEIPFRKKNIHFQWEFPRCLANVCDSDQSEDENDLAEFNKEYMERLEEADFVTRRMSREEYIEFAECRQASFTYKKAKKFKDWLGFPERYRPSDDLLDILGFLTWEFLRKLTLEALSLRSTKDSRTRFSSSSSSSSLSNSAKSINTQLEIIKEKSLFFAPAEKCPITPELIKVALKKIRNKS